MVLQLILKIQVFFEHQVVADFEIVAVSIFVTKEINATACNQVNVVSLLTAQGVDFMAVLRDGCNGNCSITELIVDIFLIGQFRCGRCTIQTTNLAIGSYTKKKHVNEQYQEPIIRLLTICI